MLGTPLDHADFVTQHPQSVTDEKQCLLERTPLIQDLQSAWLLLFHCASARANYQIRAVCPAAVELYAQTHDEDFWQCLGRILHIDRAKCSNEVRESATLALTLGGLGLRSAVRTRVPSLRASWADCLPVILERHPAVAAQLLDQLEGHPDTPILRDASDSARQVTGSLSSPPAGRWRIGQDHRRVTQNRRSSAGVEMGGSTKWHRELKKRFGKFSSPG